MNNDLISRVALSEELSSLRITITGLRAGKGVLHEFMTEYRKSVLRIVDEAPTIDAEPVVRCKDCKHWGTGYGGETEHIKVCEYANYMVGANGYCVYGERKMDEEVQ